ncbi:MAG: polysaccharide biosynthesis tyrosine autokinase [Pelatocladus maniniholoensis HA4357-MV3]|jgi:succinoglycan biosynthesis transport protein ExoP|uniref:non-specific protein-tyrosine kinase n=1 Tax=Pelatocladus maniniholoensis HA4357-MV3 TaxID=1117104 RepID=A0A9E3H8T4_9NOST|nr:polysaccharide biosynthesis tyrosine autokinase [Pelatocladus maniniholoensis HA4357-MV3]BAZ68520.1 lipopolysaccharide biosynthesis protein [Fischerella sp. NIES-4106]
MELQESNLSFLTYWQIIKRRWSPSLIVFLTVFIISLLIASLKKPSYVAEGKLKFQRTNATSTLTSLGTEIGTLQPVVQDNKTSPLNTEAEVIRSVPIVQKTIKQLNLTDNQGKPLKIKPFLKKLNVSDVRGADVIQISYKDTNPETTAKVVNTLINIYLENNIFANRTQATAARKFIGKQLPKAESIVRQAEAELANFKEKYKIVSLNEEATKGVEIITDLQKQISQTQSQIAEVEAQSQEIRKQLDMNSQQAVIMTSLSQNSGVQDILKEIQQLESQLAARRNILQNNHPEIVNLEDKLTSLKSILRQRVKNVAGKNSQNQNNNFQLGQLQQQISAKLLELESTRLGLVNQATALSNLQAEYKQRLNNLPRLEQQQRQLERKVQAAQSTYSLLLQKLQESQIAENQNVGNASVISEAIIPEEPVTSRAIIFLSAGVVASLAALANIYFLEATDKSIKTVDEAKELLGLTTLGVIPTSSKLKKTINARETTEFYNQRLLIPSLTRSPMSEAYRMLRVNLQFMSANKELKVIVVTSSVPREGKSTVAANLAMAMAQMERKVLLVDGDLEHPIQHKIWKLTNNEGLSNVICGQIEFKTAVKTVMNYLDVLTAGVLSSSSVSLLDSQKMAGLIDSFAANYDFVIIDAPSLTVAADATILGQMSDGVLLVVRPGIADSVNAITAIEILEKSGQNVLGQVVNGVIAKNEPHSYYFLEENQPQKSAVQEYVKNFVETRSH